MKNVKQIICLFYFIFLFSSLSGQDKNGYMEHPGKALEDARTAFLIGEYQKTINLVNIYHALSGRTDGKQLFDNAKACQTFIDNALQFESQSDYFAAAKCYENLLKINPSDTSAKERYENVSQKNTSFKEDRQNTAIKVGDMMSITPYDKYIVCYVDDTGQHGWVMKLSFLTKLTWINTNPTEGSGWRRPSLDEIRMIYPNRYKLGLNNSFWTCTKTKKLLRDIYVFDFGTGKEKATAYDKEGIQSIYIRNF